MIRSHSKIARTAIAIVLVGLGVLAFASPNARAQTAPEGNAHPVAQALDMDAAELPSPFGEPKAIGSAPSIADKSAFAAKLDLQPLRDLAVWHSGRVKVVDTLARETVLKIAGRKNYFDVAPIDVGKVDSFGAPEGAGKKVFFDPVFTLVDLIIDPAYYYEKPVLAIDYLPLRRAFLEAAFGEKEETRINRWLKLQRISPRMVQEFGPAVSQKFIAEAPYREALGKLDQQLEIWRLSRANLTLVAPEASDKQWAHLATLAADHPARVAAAKLGESWRKLDADGANAAIKTLSDSIRSINTAQYPTTKRDLEIFYNKANAFEWGMWAYFFTFLALVLGFGTGRRWLLGLGTVTLLIAIGLHATGFTLRCIIAERFAIQNQFESMTGVSLFAAVVGLAIMMLKRQYLFGAAAAGVGFLILITATQTAIPGQVIEREAAILNTSVLLKYHVTTVLVSYGLIALGFIISSFYLVTHYAAKMRGAQSASVVAQVSLGGTGTTAVVTAGDDASSETGGFSPVKQKILDELDTAQMTVLQLAFWTLGVGILLGAWWADHSWGRWWAFDPKETWALITWIVYLIVIHLRFTTGRNKALVTAWLSVAGFIVMLWTYFGVNLLLPGLHAYA
ncbi:MAG: cytochrome c biogenesis protein CcsA [Phycisphaerales bacterium]|nr:cytochrome c biogenesis protein CcsA [Phycisphaerales bacterium]